MPSTPTPGINEMFSNSSAQASGNSSLSYYFMRQLSLAAAGLIKIEGNKRNHGGN